VKRVVYNACFGGFSISKECAEFMADRGSRECIELLESSVHPGDETFYGYLWDTPRHDGILVLAVEHLGEAASGDCSALTIYDLQGDRYNIREHDGSETVVEPSDIKWVVV